MAVWRLSSFEVQSLTDKEQEPQISG